MNYPETIDYLMSRLPMFSRIGPAAFKKDLTNIRRLCEVLGQPQEQFKCIHVAGTNGKGSVSHMLAAILQTAGYRTGLYTSPHLRDFRERIRLNGAMIEEEFVVSFTEKIRPWIDEIEPSFFEITVAMAFEYFASKKTEMAVIETGLGGRLDSTNVVIPELSIITNIGYDHMDMLGDTLEKIAFEKAGIIKEKIPVVLGEALPETMPVFREKATHMQAPLFLAGHSWQINDWKNDPPFLDVTVYNEHARETETFRLDLPGIYQARNLVTVLEAVDQLNKKGWSISRQQVRKALGNVKTMTGLHGRWERIHRQPAVILDVAHNQDGIKQVLAQLELENYDELHLVFGMVKDKDIENILDLLPRQAAYYFTRASIPRAMPEDELARLATTRGLQGKAYADVRSALKDAMAHATAKDLILVFGSVFLVGEVDRSVFGS